MRSAESNLEDRSRPLAAPVELRIHGVGGTTPEILLGHPHPAQVAGDDTAGFYRRPTDLADSHLSDSDSADSDSLEAYSWGGITSRSGSRALWLLVLPFALTNAAGFMLKPGESTRTRLARGLLRLLALAVTVLFVLWVGGLALDLIAYQCGASTECTRRQWWLTFFENVFLQAHPNRRIAVAMLVPAAVIWALRRATTFTRTRYEEAFAAEPVEDSPTAQSANTLDPAGWAGLGDRVFWHSARFGEMLTSAHIGAATASLAGATAYAAWRIREEGGMPAQLDRWLIVVAAALGVAAAISVVFAGRGPVQVLPKLGWTLVGVVAAANLVRTDPLTLGLPADDLPGYSRAALITGLVALVLAILLMIVLIGTGPGRLIPPVATTSIGVFAMGAFLVGSHVRLADLLGDRVSAAQPQIVYSSAYDWFALGAFAVLATIAITILVAVLWLRRKSRSGAILEEISRRYPPTQADGERRTWLVRIARSEALSRLVDEADRALAVVMTIVLAGALAFYGFRTFVSGSPFGPIAAVPSGWKALIPLATWVCSAMPLVGLGIMYGSFRNPGTRRRVGVIWDIATFWPRWFHPLAPPPYAARAVPELGVRLHRLVSEGASVTLSGHSQGSILAASTLARVPAADRARLSLITHGSPLGRLYGRFFPAYFGPEFIADLLQRIGGRWINLFRKTDPIGGPVSVAKVDVSCPDPETDHREPGDPLPPVKGHAFYAGSKAYVEALAFLNHGDERRQRPDAGQQI